MDRLEFAREVIAEAGRVALEHFGRPDQLQVRSKGRHDVVTAADAAVEALVKERVLARFPSDSFLGEESGADGVSKVPGPLWVVDPIDGTQEFARGTRSWCVVIALVDRERVQFGLVLDPNTGELFEARHGGGATLNGNPIHVSAATSLEDGLVTVEISARNSIDDVLGTMRRLLEAGGSYTRSGSGALALCYVACGRSIGFVEAHMYPWDCLAANLIITEAGGTAVDFIAQGSMREGGPVAAAPPQLFAQVAGLLPANVRTALVPSTRES
jgi:myo-inositol-1(or 4)-monophosphatase